MTDELTSYRIDPIAAVAAVLYALGLVAGPVMMSVFIARQEWVLTAAAGGMTVIFGVLLYGWSQAAQCRIRIDADGVRRAGPLGWQVSFAEIAEYRLPEVRGRTYVMIRPQHPPKRNNMSAAMLGAAVPYGSFTGPLHAEKVAAFRTALRQRVPGPADS